MPAPSLTVTLSGGNAADARTVVRTLEPTFGTAEGELGDTGATVHTATFVDDSEKRTPDGGSAASGGRLSSALTVTVQGTPEAVRKAHEALTHAFTARDEGSSSGDQEQELQLRLEP